MSFLEGSGYSSHDTRQEDFILIPHNSQYYVQSRPETVAEKRNLFFTNSTAGKSDEHSGDDPNKSVKTTSGLNDFPSMYLYDSAGAERRLNVESGPTEKDISLVTDFAKRKSDGLCQITLSNKPSTLQHFQNAKANNSSLVCHDEMETSRLDDDDEVDEYSTLPTNTLTRLNVEDIDKMERHKMANGENGVLKSVKGTVRGYKNMVRRYSASFNSKGHVIPLLGQSSNKDDAGKIIIYTTSVTAVRSTTEACSYVKKVFQNRGLPYEERDVFIHKEHQKEMQSRLGKGVSLPQVVINGIHIGGLKEIEDLNESGQIVSLTSCFERRYGGKECQRCGGRRFINCNSCGGSKRSRKHRIVREICSLRCTSCNENGLMACPECAVNLIKE